MSMEEDLKELKEASENLLQLLNAPEPGLFTWHIILKRQVLRIVDVANKSGMSETTK